MCPFVVALVAATTYSVISVASGKGLNTAVCTPYTDNGGRDLPNIPNTFSAKYILYDRLANASLYIEEYFSQEANTGSLFVTDLHSAGSTTMFMTLGQTGEQVTIIDMKNVYDPDNCVVSSLDPSNQMTFPFKPNDKINGTTKDNVMSGRTVLAFGADDGLLRYNGTATVNGIDLDVWLGCLYDSSVDMTFRATLYFSRQDSSESWITATGDVSIKRVDMTGMSSDNSSLLDSTYDYVLFDNEISDEEWITKFETPAGSVCKGRQTTKAVPNVPQYFSFQAEILDPFNQIATYTDEWYDFFANYSRMDFVAFSTTDPSSPPQVVSIINDFTTGISYQINPRSGSCVVSYINPDEFDSVVVGANLTRMRSPKEFFSFDGDDYPWHYNGRRKVRDIDTDVWASYRPFPTRQSSLMAVWEWYFSADNWRLVDNDLVEVNVPVRLIVTAGNDIKQEYNIYRFNEDEPGIRAFDVSACFDAETASRGFELRVKADVNKYGLSRNVDLLAYLTILSLEDATQVRALRIQDVEFEFADTAFLVRFSVLGPAPMQGDVTGSFSDTPLTDAVASLKDWVKTSRFVIGWVDENSKTAFFTAEPDSLVEIGRNTGGNSVYFIEDDSSQATAPSVVLSSGGAAALALSMVVVGLLLVALPYWFVWRRKKAPHI